MNGLDNIAALMIQGEMAAYEGARFQLSNHTVKDPETIRLQADEVAFITEIRVQTNSDFVLDYYSALESRKHQSATSREYSICTRHRGVIYFRITPGAEYHISYTVLKIMQS
jgi:hypothetical protein